MHKFWLVPLNTRPVKAALNAKTEHQNEVKKRAKDMVWGSLDEEGGNRPSKRSAPELQQDRVRTKASWDRRSRRVKVAHAEERSKGQVRDGTGQL